jgi:HlyD family secretion protein
MSRSPSTAFVAALVLLTLLAGCAKDPSNIFQGYAEGDFVYIAAPAGGILSHRDVNRGSQVAAGTVLFGLDQDNEIANQRGAAARLAQARAQLENLRKGKRPQEMDVIQAQLSQAEATLELSESTLRRQQALFDQQFVSQEALEIARSGVKRDRARVEELRAQETTARLGARRDEIRAAEAEVANGRAAVTQAEWNLAQKSQKSPRAGLVTDTFYEVGEWVPAGRPVVSVLPPENIKLRFFVPENRLSSVHIGLAVAVACDGCPVGLRAAVSYVAPQAEYTPPLIYSRETRSKLVYLVEARFAPGAPTLKPGQPVEVKLERTP